MPVAFAFSFADGVAGCADDARLWHRACPELNRTDSWRVAILNCVLPSWVVPMLPREQGAEMFVDSYVRIATASRNALRLFSRGAE